MINKLKRRLILIELLSVGIVITIILFSSYAASMIKITKAADELIDILADNNGEFPDPNNKIDAETIMKTRFFTYRHYDDESIPDDLDISKNFIEESIAKSIVKKTSDRLFNKGYIYRGSMAGRRTEQYGVPIGLRKAYR